MNIVRRYGREVVLGVLILTTLCVWVLVLQKKASPLLHVYFLDVGQGDSILIDSPTHGKVLIDGGPNARVLSELGKILPFGDRRIDVMIETHPDADHISGLVDVVRRYDIGTFLEPGVESDNHIDDLLREEIRKRNIPHLLARRGMVIDFHDGVELYILFPDQDVSAWETNDASVVAKLVYGTTSFLLTGDSTKKAEYMLLAKDRGVLDADVLKAGHHGSATSDSVPYVEAVSPLYAVISAGTGNKYGLPKKEILDVFTKVGAQIISTESVAGLTGKGTIEFESDGKNLIVK